MSLPRRHSATNHPLLIAALSLILATSTHLAFAEPRAGHQRTQGESQRNQEEVRARISAQQAAAIVQRQYGGKVMNVTTYKRKGNIIHGVKILQNSGHMRTVQVDGQTGAILN